MNPSSGSLIIVLVLLFLGLMSGFWAGLVGLWKGRRGAAWWLMAIGVALITIGPILYGLGMWAFIDAFTGGSTGRSGSGAIVLITAGLSTPLGLLLFSVGFGMHGFGTARLANRNAELEQLTAAMSEEIDRLRMGGPVA